MERSFVSIEILLLSVFSSNNGESRDRALRRCWNFDDLWSKNHVWSFLPRLTNSNRHFWFCIIYQTQRRKKLSRLKSRREIATNETCLQGIKVLQSLETKRTIPHTAWSQEWWSRLRDIELFTEPYVKLAFNVMYHGECAVNANAARSGIRASDLWFTKPCSIYYAVISSWKK